MADSKRTNEPWELEYKQFLATDRAKHAFTDGLRQDVAAKPVKNWPLNETVSVIMLDSTLQRMDETATKRFGTVTYDNLVGLAWRADGNDMPHIATAMLTMAGVNLDSLEAGK